MLHVTTTGSHTEIFQPNLLIDSCSTDHLAWSTKKVVQLLTFSWPLKRMPYPYSVEGLDRGFGACLSWLLAKRCSTGRIDTSSESTAQMLLLPDQNSWSDFLKRAQ